MKEWMFWTGLITAAIGGMGSCAISNSKQEADLRCYQWAQHWSKDSYVGPKVREILADKVIARRECGDLKDTVIISLDRRKKDQVLRDMKVIK